VDVRPRVDSRLAERAGQTVVVAEAALLVTWVFAPRAATAVGVGGVPTRPTTALALLLIGAVLGWPALSRRAASVLLTIAGALAVEGILAAALARPLLAAFLPLPESWQAVSPSGIGGMAVTSAVCVLTLVGALTVGAAWPRLTTVLGLTAFSLAYAGVLGHVYGVSGLYTLQTTTSMAAPTAVAGLALASGAVMRSDRFPVPRALHARGTAGALLRSLAGWALVLPPVASWLVVHAIQEGWTEPATGLAVLAVLSAAGGVLLALVGARTAARTDRAREAAADELEALNAVLSERVAVAVHAAEEGRERLGFLLDTTPVGIFETGPDGVRTYVNQRWRELTGVVDGQLGDGSFDVLHPDDREWVARAWAESVEAGNEYSARYRYLRPDGLVTWVDATALAVRGSDGQVTRWLGSVTDVTGQVESATRLSESEQRYRSVVASMAEGVVLTDPAGRIVTVNDAACRLLGYAHEDLVGEDTEAPRWPALRDDGSELPGEEHPAAVALRTGEAVRDVTMGVTRPDGSQVWLSVSAEPVVDTDDPERGVDGSGIKGVVTTFADVTEARSASAALRRSEEQFRHAMALAPIGMALVELDGTFREVNRSMARLVGYDEDELVGRTFQSITHPDDVGADVGNVSRLIDGSLDHYTMEKRYLTKVGKVVWVLLAVSMARDGQDRPAYLIAQIQDITDTRAAQQRLAHQALHDPLTGLPNRDQLMDHLSHTLARSARSGTSTVVMFCDLDHFKQVNDTYGHEAGDQLLIAVSERLRAVMRPGDSVGRLGGDEFVVVAEAVSGAAVVQSLAERVRGALEDPIQVGDEMVKTGVSIGVAVADGDDDARAVLREADAAMYRAKARGRGRLEVSEAAAAWDRSAPAKQSVVQDPRPRGA
jgi:diguanylate cyclase (GGDEF)-like protein/PAS domain S-box-containing protein